MEKCMNMDEKTEEQLAAELEDMYRRVASIEKPEMEENRNHDVHASGRREETTLNKFPEDVHGTAGLASEVIPDPVVADMPREKRPSAVIGALVIVFVCLCVLLYAAFFWPTLYDISTINTGNRNYPIRMNRITGNVLYFDGGQWRNTPIPAPAAADPSVLPSDKTALSLRQDAPTPAPATVPSTAPTPAPASATTPTPATSPVPAGAATAPPPDPKGSSGHPVTPDRPSKALAQRPFAIQLQSFKNQADAQGLIAELKNIGADVYSVAASIGTRGIWHRVLIGRFKDQREAVKFMQEHKIRDSYPDSFIRKLPL